MTILSYFRILKPLLLLLLMSEISAQISETISKSINENIIGSIEIEGLNNPSGSFSKNDSSSFKWPDELVNTDNTSSVEICGVSQQVQYNLQPGDFEAISRENGSIDVRGFTYRQGTWKVGDNGTSLCVCPCLNQQCIQHCSNLDNVTMQNSLDSLNITKQMVLDYHFWSIEDNTDNTRKIIKINASGWKTSDLFRDFFVVEEGKYTDHDEKYVEIDVNDMTVEKLDDTCFAFNGNNQTIAFFKLERLIRLKTLAVCCIVSVISLFILIAAFAITGEFKELHGKNMLCQAITLIATFIGFIINYLSLFERKSEQCYVTGYLFYYASMSMFFWLSVICFDVYGTMCKDNVASTSVDKKKFRWYSFYAWTSPLLLTLAVYLNQKFYSRKDSFKLEIGENACFLDISYNEKFWCAFAYFYGPMLILLIINWGFFAATICKIFIKIHYVRNTTFTEENNTSANKLKFTKFLASCKLFVIMGGLWITEIISWAIQKYDGIWHVFNVINCLRGLWLLIFCVVFNSRTRSRLL